MISNIFGKTKPINFIIICSFLFVLYWFVNFVVYDKSYLPEELIFQLLVLSVLLFSIFVADFILQRNKVTSPNSFGILFYGLLTLVFSETLTDNKAIFCSLFLLLALRRIISIRSLKSIKLKIFDATLWIMVASLFYEWAVLYLLLVFAAIYIYEPKNIRNWLVPLTSIFAVFMVAYGMLVLTNNTDFLMHHYQFTFEFNKVYFSSWGNSTKLVIYILSILLVSVFAFLKLGKAGLGQIVTMRLVGFAFVIGLIVKVLNSTEGSYPIMITFFPAVVFVTNYVEAIKKANIKEIILMISVVLPFLVFFTEVALK
jgi:hypothetical protein